MRTGAARRPLRGPSLRRLARRLAGLAGATALAAPILTAPLPVRAEMAGAFPHVEAWPGAIALGGIPEGLGEGVEAALENPTGMLVRPARGLAFSHASLFEGGLVSHQAAALCWIRRENLTEWRQGTIVASRGEARSAFGLAVTNLSGDLPPDTLGQDDSYGELQIALSYARRAPLGLRTGVRLRILQARSTVPGTEGGGLAFDLGLEGTVAGFRAGGVARALFSEVRWDRSLDGPIPRAFDLAIERDLRGGLRILAGGTIRSSGRVQRLAVATEWRVLGSPMRLRGGPAWRDNDDEQRAEISGGAAFEIGSFTADYGMRTGPPGLGEIHRFGLRVALP